MQSIRSTRDDARRRLATLRLPERTRAARERAGAIAGRIPDPATLPGLRRFPRATTFVLALVGAIAVYALISAASGALYAPGDPDAAPVYTV